MYSGIDKFAQRVEILQYEPSIVHVFYLRTSGQRRALVPFDY